MNALAIDLGSGSGRGVLGVLNDSKIESIREIYRFENNFLSINGGIYWDYLAMYRGIIQCLCACRTQGIKVDSIGIDAWAQDYAYIGQNGEILGIPRSYRDPLNLQNGFKFETDNALEKEDFRESCGVGYGTISTLRQLWSDRETKRQQFEYAKSFLFIPYLMVYLLTGVLAYDVSLPVIGELGDVHTGDFRAETMKLLGLQDKLPRRFKSGEVIGYTGRSVYEATGLESIPIICTQAHDTTSAVSAIPDQGEYLWVSSGSFNMLGAVLHHKIIKRSVLDAGFCNTPLNDGRNCLMCGSGAGMYYMQQCMKVWKAQGKDISYRQLTDYALEHQSERFFSFDQLPTTSIDMAKEISNAIEKAGFGLITDPFDIYEAFSNSLAQLCTQKILFLIEETDLSFGSVYVISGGSNALDIDARMAQLLGKSVYVGLPEASAIGNLMSQWNTNIDVGKNWDFFKMRRF
jgi:rhamnulokinase